jgi:tetratricopeptide (TPR) repeat protein
MYSKEKVRKEVIGGEDLLIRHEETGRRAQEPSPRLTLCLAMDLKGSTATGMKLSTRRRDRFNLVLVNQLHPYLEAVGLESALIKFTGDGWLIMSDDPDDAAPMCCLAMIMAQKFQHDMSEEAALPLDHVPALRLALCWARDLPVMLPDGQRDFVGDSARHAVRACQLCYDNEVLIDETVRRWVNHDFVIGVCDFQARLAENPGAKAEEELVLYVLEELKAESAAEADAPIHFVNTLTIIGRGGEAEALANRIADQLQNEAAGEETDKVELVGRFNRLLAGNLEYGAASRILRDMRDAGVKPNVDTFNSLIAKTEDHATQWIWFQRMRQESVEPNIKTFNILIEHAPDEAMIHKWLTRMKRANIQPDTMMLNMLIGRSKDYAGAVRWLEKMEKEGVQPNAATFDLLIEKATDIASAKFWIDRMFESNIQPSLVTFLALFSKDVRTMPADELLQWYLKLPYHPPEPMHRAISAYRKAGMIEDALRLALDYPYTEAARSIFRKYPEQSLSYFHSIVEMNPDHPNGAYALGIALFELGRHSEAQPWLQRALELAAPGPRRNEVKKYLEIVRTLSNSELRV